MRNPDFRILELTGTWVKNRNNEIHPEISRRFILRLLECEPDDHEMIIPAILSTM